MNVQTIIERRTVYYLRIPNPATARDLSDLITAANDQYEEIHGVKPVHDDAYTIEADDRYITAVIKGAAQHAGEK